MKLSDKLTISKKIILNKLFGLKKPICINFALTHHCNFKCRYCNFWQSTVRDMDTQQVISIISQLSDLGVNRIHFTGGEPLIREDIGEILRYTKEKGIFTVLNTNGWLLSEKIEEASFCNLIQISLEGKEGVHDSRTRRGSYKRIIEAVKLLKERKISFGFTMVIDKENLNQVDYMLNLVRILEGHVYFQLAQPYPYSADIASRYPEPKKLRQAIKKILREKKHNSYIGNSSSFLLQLLKYPNFKRINCKAGDLFARIEANGKLVPCYENKTSQVPNLKKVSVKKAFEVLKKERCGGCYDCCYLEYNNIFNLNPRTLLHFNRIVR